MKKIIVGSGIKYFIGSVTGVLSDPINALSSESNCGFQDEAKTLTWSF